MKTLVSLAIAALILASVSNCANAQTGTIGTSEGDKTVLEQNVYGLGLNFSLLSGMGLAFKQHFAHSPFSYMLTGYVWKDKSGTTYDYGVELQYDIYMKEATRFYVHAGWSNFYNGSKAYRFDPITDGWDYVESNELDGPQRLGGGAGFEVALGYSVGFFMDLSLTSFQPDGDLMILPYAGLLIYFK